MIKKILNDLNNNPQQKLILMVVLMLIAVFLFINFILRPQIIKIAGAGVKMSTLSKDINEGSSEINDMQKMKSLIESYNKKIGLFRTTLPTEEGIPNLLESLAAMAKSANVRIVGIVPTTSREGRYQGQAYVEIPIAISAKSGYHELAQFIDKIESSDRFMKIADMRIKSNPMTPKKHDIEMLIFTYVLRGG